MSQHKWSHRFLRPGDYKHVEATVAQVEKTTTGEIVPMIVKSSSTTGTLPTLIAMMIVILGFFTQRSIPSTYITKLTMILFFVATLLVSYFLSRVSFVQRWLLPKHDLARQVHMRAFAEFSHLHIDRTQTHTGILIFVSLMERQVVVLADQGISSKLPKEIWKNVIDMILDGIKKGKPCDGLVAGIQKCGEILTQHFPAQGPHKTELRNHLVVKE